MLLDDELAEDVVTAVLADFTPEDALQLALAASWATASFLRQMDRERDGFGTAWLRELAAELAQEPPQGD